MELSKYSKLKFFSVLNGWYVDADNMHQVYNYLVHGLSPGSFHEALFSNDATAALSRVYPASNLQNLSSLASYLRSSALWNVAFGSHEVVDAWLRMTEEQRRQILIDADMVNSEARDIDLALRDDHDPSDNIMLMKNDSTRIFFDIRIVT